MFEPSKVTSSLTELTDIALIEVNQVHHEKLAPVHYVLALHARPVTPAGRILKKHTGADTSPDMLRAMHRHVAQMEEPYIRGEGETVVPNEALKAIIDAMYVMVEQERGPNALARVEDFLRAIINHQDEQVESLFDLAEVDIWKLQAELKETPGRWD